MAGIDGLLRRHTALWARCDGRRAPRFGRRYTPREQSSHESAAVRFLDRAEPHLNSGARFPAVQDALLPHFRDFARQALDLAPAQIDLLVDGFPEVGRRLGADARSFDPAVSAADVFQASRNAWVAGGLQALLGRPMRLTPAIFGYSMLYPYTDNYLDDPAVPAGEKRAFNARFRQRLAGQDVAPVNERERQVWALIERIEREYRRAEWPEVYRSLLAIHTAQEASVSLRRGAGLANGAVLDGVFAKGGASVLADAYLAAGRLTASEAGFAYGWGVLLQLGDDLQDVAADVTDGTATLFSESAGREPLDGLTNRVFEFGESVFAGLRAFRAPGALPLKRLIRRSASTLLVTAAGLARHWYTRPYVAALQPYSPFRFAFVRERQRQLLAGGGLLARLMAAAG